MVPSFMFPKSISSLEEDDASCYAPRLTVKNSFSLSSLRPSELEEFVRGIFSQISAIIHDFERLSHFFNTGTCFDLSDKELFCVEEQDIFDRLYALVKEFSALKPGCKFNLVESLRSNLSVLLPNVDSLSRSRQSLSRDDDDDCAADRVASHRNAFKIYTFFLVRILLVEESTSTSVNNAAKVTCFFRSPLKIQSYLCEQTFMILVSLGGS